jgi:NTP pyrophosphatase (non-canonical NTP hydrolase)
MQDLFQKFCEDRDWDQFHSPKELAIGLVTESAELLDIFRFKSNEEINELLLNPKSREHIEEEIADVFTFILRFAQLHNIDLEKAFLAKLEKNNLKYPADKVRGKNKKYTEY